MGRPLIPRRVGSGKAACGDAYSRNSARPCYPSAVADHPGRVLVVTDAPSLGPELATTLEASGLDAVCIDSGGLAGLALEPGLLAAIVDARDAEHGLRSVEALRARSRVLPVLVLAPPGAAEALARLPELGADDVLFHPLAEGEIEARIAVRSRQRDALDELRRREDHGRVMLELTRTLSSSLDFEDILFEVAHRIAEVIQVDRCSIVLTAGDQSKGFVVASSEDRGVRDLRLDLSKYPEVRKVLSDGKLLVIDVETDPLLDAVRSSIPKGGHTTSALFPITHETRPMGVLFLRFRARREDLTDRELDFCQTVANATAIALRNARIVSALRDEQARMSHAASEAERKAEALSHYVDFFESSADGMLVVDREGRVLYANPRISALTGRSVGELIDCTLEDLVEDEERGALSRLRGEFARGAYPRGLDLRFRGAGDEPLVLSVSASSTVRIERGVLLTLRDVTASRATEAELRRTKEFLEGLIAQSVDAIIASDMRGRLLLFNPAAERILGYQASEVLGFPLIEKMYPPGVARDIMRRLRSEEHGGVGRLEQTRATIVAKDGTEVPISMTGGLILEDGEPRATFGIFTDLRPLLEIENDLARTRLELMEREREAIAAQLAGAAAHELNQPLTSVMAAVSLLRRRLGESSGQSDTIDTLLAETERMAQIVRKVGRITHYETKAYVGSTRILDLDAAARSEELAPSIVDLNPFDAEDREDHEDTFVGRTLALEAVDPDPTPTGAKEPIPADPAPESPVPGDVVARLRSGAASSVPPPAAPPEARADPSEGAEGPKEDTQPRAVFRMEEDEEREDTQSGLAMPPIEEGEDTNPTGATAGRRRADRDTDDASAPEEPPSVPSTAAEESARGEEDGS